MIRCDRKYLPKNLKNNKTSQKGEFDYCVSDESLVFYKWRDNKVVTLLSDIRGTGSTTALRTQKDRRRIDFNCHVALKDYNTFVGGVDKAPMLIYIIIWIINNIQKNRGIEYILV